MAGITELNIHANEYWKRVQKAADRRTVRIILDKIDKMLISRIVKMIFRYYTNSAGKWMRASLELPTTFFSSK